MDTTPVVVLNLGNPPLPPPILNKPNASIENVLRRPPLSVAESDRPTIPAGGALLSRSEGHVPDLVPGVVQGHRKTDSVHAHFYVDDTIKHGPQRLRSTSVGDRDRARPEATNVDPRLAEDGKFHVLIGCTGLIAAGKIRYLISKLEGFYGKDRISVHVVLTQAAESILQDDLPGHVTVWRDNDEWTLWKTRSDPVLHIELRRWADVLIVAPLTANTLAKIALGLCDNLLTNVIRAWNTQFPIILAPSMVNYSYNSAITKKNLDFIKEHMPWIEVVKPTEKVFGSYGEIGMGGMSTENEILAKVRVIMKGRMGEKEEDENEDDDGDDNDNDNDNDKDDSEKSGNSSDDE